MVVGCHEHADSFRRHKTNSLVFFSDVPASFHRLFWLNLLTVELRLGFIQLGLPLILKLTS